MRGLSQIILISALIISSSFFVACTNTNTPESEKISLNYLEDYVSDAAEYAKIVGDTEAFSAFTNLNGPFTTGDLYIYAYDFNGTLLAHPYQSEDIGTNRMDWTDAKGLPVIKVADYLARLGGGFIAYMYPAPEGGAIDEAAIDTYVPKIGYVLPVDEGWWIGSGVYLSDLGDPNAEKVISDMINLVERGAVFAQQNDENVAFKAISDPNGIFVDQEGHYLYAYGYNGTMLAHAHMHDKIGTNLIDHTSAFGEKDILALSSTAKNGGGYVVFSWENPQNGNNKELKIGYVLPVDEDWWIGSGVYLSEITGNYEKIGV